MVRFRPAIAGTRPELARLTLSDIIKGLLKPWQFVAVIGVTLGGIYAGWFTPTEAGAIGAFATFVMCILRRRLTKSTLWSIILDAGHTMAGLYFLFICATMYSRMLAISGLPVTMTQMVASMQAPPFFIILLIIAIYIMLGAIIDSVSILILTIPLFHPVIQAMGFDPFWFAVVSVITIEMGLITPPFGMVVFAIKASVGESITVEEIFRGMLPWIIMMAVALIIICLYPPLSTYLPHKMGG